MWDEQASEFPRFFVYVPKLIVVFVSLEIRKPIMYSCPKCNAPFDKGTKFCPQCGCNLEDLFIETPVCPVCHTTYPAGALYCTVDGARLVSPDKLIPKCVICGTQYSADTKFCPKDGGAVIPEALGNSNYIFRKADLGKRFLASLLDGLISLMLSIPAIFFYVVGLNNVSSTYYGEHDYSNASVFFVFAFFLYLIPLVYMFVKDGLGDGQSLGKQVMKIKTINVSDNSKCSKGTSALRALLTSLINLIPLVGWIIEPIMVLVNPDGRRIADKIAGTMVVNV